MVFLWPTLLWLLLAVPLLVALYAWLLHRRKQQALNYPSLGPGQRLRRHIPPTLFLLALVALRAKVDGGAQVQQKPGRHFAVFGEHAQMGRGQARRDGPGDVADIGGGLVLAQIGQVEPAAAHQRAVVALQQAVEPPSRPLW